MAAALSGAVVVRDDGKGNIQYREKCDHCGKISSTTVHTTVQPGSRLTCGGFTCIYCKQRSSVEIEG